MVKPITECKVKLFRVWRLPSHSTRQKVHDVYFSEQKRKFIVHGQRKRPFLTRITIWRTYSRLRSRGSEVVGQRENGRARRRLKNWNNLYLKSWTLSQFSSWHMWFAFKLRFLTWYHSVNKMWLTIFTNNLCFVSHSLQCWFLSKKCIHDIAPLFPWGKCLTISFVHW